MYLFYSLLSIQVLIAIAIVVLVLLQPHEGEGMGAVFGGSSSVETFLGTKTISVLWKATVVLGVLFISLAVLLNIISKRGRSDSAVGNDPAVEESTENGSTNGSTQDSAPDNSSAPSGESSSGDGSESDKQ